MAFTVVQTVTASGAGPGAITATPAATASGNLLIVIVSQVGSTNTAVLSDNKGSTYIAADTVNNTNGISGGIYYLPNCASGINSVSDTTGGTSPKGMIFREYSGVLSTAGTDVVHNAVSAGSANPNSGATATTNDPIELVIGWMAEISTTAPTLGSGYGNLTTVVSTTTSVTAIEDLTTSTQGAQTATFTDAISVSSWVCGVAAFKSVVAANNPRLRNLLGVGF